MNGNNQEILHFEYQFSNTRKYFASKIYPNFAQFEACLPDVEVKADLSGSSSGRSLSIAQRLDEICS